MEPTPFTTALAYQTDCADVHARRVEGDERLVLLDARSTADFASRHIPGASSVPHSAITTELLDAFGPDREFVTYCWGPHCNGATKAAAVIAGLGFEVREMLGGMWGWEQEGYRFVGDDVGVRIGLLCFDGVDLLDVGGPYEVLLTANRLRTRADRPAPFEVRTISGTAIGGAPSTVVAYGGLGLQPTSTVAATDYLDVLIVPGAIDVDAARPDAALATLAERSDVIASVCTGAFFLARNGLLDDRTVTTHWEDVASLDHPDVVDDRRWVDQGDIITSGGISSGIAMALHLVERYADRDLAEATARQIDYDWTQTRTHTPHCEA